MGLILFHGLVEILWTFALSSVLEYYYLQSNGKLCVVKV